MSLLEVEMNRMNTVTDRQILPSHFLLDSNAKVDSAKPPSCSRHEFSHGLPRLRRVRVAVQIQQ